VGTSFWQTTQIGGPYILIVEYSENHFVNHWCQNGQIVYCLKGEFESGLKHVETIRLSKGTTFIVSDEQISHRSIPN